MQLLPPRPPRILRARVDGTGSLERKVLSVLPTALASKPSQQLKSRETTKGADVSERGDPLLIIINQKQFIVCSRRHHSSEMADRWGRRLIYHATHPRPTPQRSD